MKPTELMIGDWVRNIPNENAERVMEIRKNGVMLARDYIIYDEDEIEPIKLTPEILIQNKFEARGDNCFTYTYSYGWFLLTVRCYVKVKNCLLYIDQGDVRDFRQGIKSEIKYVHELQQALRFCKSTNEITI